MNMVLFLILRRMRAPLLALSLVYSVATLGLTIIPGMDDQGNPWHMDFFHAFYFVSFMGKTMSMTRASSGGCTISTAAPRESRHFVRA